MKSDGKSPDCIFCKFIANKKLCNFIWEDKNFFAFLDINPINAGHTLLVPKLHVDYVFDLPPKIYDSLFVTAKNLAVPMKKAMNAKRIGLAVEGFGVPHAHIHLVPLNRGNELNPERARPASKEELAQAERKIKSELKEF